MIGQAVKHGRSARDARNLCSHLLKDSSARIEVINSAAPSLEEVVGDMMIARDGTRADAAFLHLAISPSRDMSEEELRRVADIVLKHFNAEEHQAAFVIHEKDRANGKGKRHGHLVVGRAGPDGQVLPAGFEKIRLETAMRIAEFELDEPPMLGRHHASSVKWLRENGRADVATWLEQAHGQNPNKPQSSASPEKRQKIERVSGMDLSAITKTVQSAWERSDSGKAFAAALAEDGFDVAPGQKAGVWIVSKEGKELGALDRILKQKRRDVAQIMEAYDRDPNPPKHTPARPGKGYEGDLPADKIRKPSRAAASAAAVVVGVARGGQPKPRRTTARHLGNNSPGPEAPSPEPRRSALEDRRPLEAAQLNRALRGFQLSPAAQQASAEIKNRSLPGTFPRLTSALIDRALGSSALDRVWRLAWDVRDAIQDVRLRIKHGKAIRHTSDPKPSIKAPPALRREDVLAAVRAKILSAKVSADVAHSPSAFKM